MRTSTKLIGVAAACITCCAAPLAITTAGAGIGAADWPWGVALAVVAVPLGTLAMLQRKGSSRSVIAQGRRMWLWPKLRLRC